MIRKMRDEMKNQQNFIEITENTKNLFEEELKRRQEIISYWRNEYEALRNKASDQ